MNHFPYKIRKTCRLCDSSSLKNAVPLIPIPVISPNVAPTPEARSAYENLSAPLDLFRCESCGLLQVTTIIDPHLQYDTFLYRTSVSLGLAEHFADFVRSHSQTHPLQKNELILEVGSNDGTLLQLFKDQGAKVLGIDPARSIAQTATDRGIPTLPEFFTEELAKKIAREHGKARTIISNNTIANLDDLSDLANGIKACLAPDGIFIFETQYGLDVIEKMLLDVIYHEHLSYFTIKPLQAFFRKVGLEVIHAERIAPKGGSIRVFVAWAGGARIESSVAELIATEEQFGLYTDEPYRQFQQRLEAIRTSLHEAIQAARASKSGVAAYGTSVGCAALINQFKLAEKLDFLVDDTPFKDELSGSDYRLPVKSRENLAASNVTLVIVLAWRYANAIRQKNTDYLARGGQFLVPLPEPTWITH